jgi:cytochrome b6-f complex iron-sulfur subunit
MRVPNCRNLIVNAKMMNRREFISLVGVGGVVSSLPATLTACNPKVADNPSVPSSSAASSDGFQVVGTVTDLDKNGQLLNEKLAVGKVLVIRDMTNAGQLVAVNPTCNHAGCSVAWQPGEKAFVCPCHDSKFASNGKVMQGPADQPLVNYTAKIAGNQVLIKAG